MDAFFGLNKTHPGVKNVKLLTTVYDNGSFAIIRSLLDGENIPYITKDRGAGEVVKILTGMPLFGTDIYVPEDCYDFAVELITANEEFCGEEDDDGLSIDMDNDYESDED